MIDLHCHILPGIDDGADIMEESCMMARMALDCGVTCIAATPHCNVPGQLDNYAGERLSESFESLRRELVAEGLPLRLCEGMEVFATPQLPELLDEGKLLTLGGSRYLLIEFGFDETERFVERMLGAVEERGLVPVIAHPERYYFVQDAPETLESWAAGGRILQLNKGSFFGMFGRYAAKTAHWCLERGCIHLIGSDAHSPYRRTTRLDDIYDYVADVAGLETAELLLNENPAKILEDRGIFTAFMNF